MANTILHLTVGYVKPRLLIGYQSILAKPLVKTALLYWFFHSPIGWGGAANPNDNPNTGTLQKQ